MDFRDFFKAKICALCKKFGEAQVQAAQATGVSGRCYQNLEFEERGRGL